MCSLLMVPGATIALPPAVLVSASRQQQDA
uniref:Uncharacterized protein n=1 Tax=Arundo donax TaxID=35708 RepID=A0A0A9A1Y2_ARUDO